MPSLTVWECDQCKTLIGPRASYKDFVDAGWHNVNFDDYFAGLHGVVTLCPACFPTFVLAGLAAAVQI